MPEVDLDKLKRLEAAATPEPWEFGVRRDGSMWLSLGNPKSGPHYQGDLVASETDAQLLMALRRATSAIIAEIEELRRDKVRLGWRPIAEIHEDYYPCVLMNIADPTDLVVGGNIDADWDVKLWTHFAMVPRLSIEQAERLEASMPQPAPEVKP